ncbi:MAG: PIN domain-containing protein [Fibrobacteres bacterium]|nr:PIN domain-containing protein [Fibrobacterota bacterium]
MNKSVFVDTSAWFAGLVKNDQAHKKATTEQQKLVKGKARFFTSNLVVHETTMLLERKVNRREAINFLSTIITDPNVEIIHASPNIEHDAYMLYKKYNDQDYSMTDCVSFEIMKHFNIQRAFTFDEHFITRGFGVVPQINY